MATAQQTGILYIDRTWFAFYGDKMAGVVRVEINDKIMKDLEILDKETLEEQIKMGIQTNNILPGVIAIVLSESVCFAKEFSEANTPFEEEQFFENIPFEYVLKRVYTFGKTKSIVATNQDLCMIFKSIFEKYGFFVETIAPMHILGIPMQNGLDEPTMKVFLGKYNLLKENNLLSLGQITSTPVQKEQNTKKINIRVVLLLLFFLLSVGVLVFMLLNPQNN